MKHYIDKDILTAEIEKLKGKASDSSSYCNGWQQALSMLEIELNTLETKEVDLEKEVTNWWNDHYSRKDYTFEKYNGHYLENSTVIEIAKHFFELGLNTGKEV